MKGHGKHVNHNLATLIESLVTSSSSPNPTANPTLSPTNAPLPSNGPTVSYADAVYAISMQSQYMAYPVINAGDSYAPGPTSITGVAFAADALSTAVHAAS